ncbi:MAG: hypothetical protein IT373_24660 [Polyangiaceae bacterium]|nr:hypothetical protein [Polyangiaceae bacterium]
MSRLHCVAIGVVALALGACESGGDAPKTTSGASKTASVKPSASTKASATPTATATASATTTATAGETASPTVSATVSAAASAPATASAATTASAAATGSATAGADASGIPDIPAEKSNPPSMDEWNKAAEINTQDANSRPHDCHMKIMREWLKVHCDGKVTGVKDMDGFGNENDSYFQMVKPGLMADFVVRMRKGVSMKLRILREDQDAFLFFNWPGKEPKPTNIALGIGKR